MKKEVPQNAWRVANQVRVTKCNIIHRHLKFKHKETIYILILSFRLQMESRLEMDRPLEIVQIT